MSARKDTARRWVIDERKTDHEIAHLIVVGYDEGPARIEMEGYVNEARAEEKWWRNLEDAYRASGYQPDIEKVAPRLNVSSKTLRKQVHDHGIPDWRDLHTRFS